MKGILLCDAYSNIKAKIYALKGDKVDIIMDCGTALIVEKDGKRFPISKHKVKIDGINNTP